MAQRSNSTQQLQPCTIEDVAAAVGVYPLAAYEFLQRGLAFTACRIHGEVDVSKSPASRHVSGRQLCEGLRLFAQMHYGMMARAVLQRWNITSTHDFGRIVFALIEAGILQKTAEDSIEDFRNVFDFEAFDTTYRISSKL